MKFLTSECHTDIEFYSKVTNFHILLGLSLKLKPEWGSLSQFIIKLFQVPPQFVNRRRLNWGLIGQFLEILSQLHHLILCSQCMSCKRDLCKFAVEQPLQGFQHYKFGEPVEKIKNPLLSMIRATYSHLDDTEIPGRSSRAQTNDLTATSTIKRSANYCA